MAEGDEPTAAAAPKTSRESRTQLRQMLAIGGIASALGIALALLIDWFPVPASTQAGPIDTLWDVLLIASVPIFVLMQTIVLYSAWRFRMRPGEELKDGPPIHGHTRLEVIWTAIPAILLVGLCTYAYVVLTDIEKAEANSMQVRVVGEQFTWTFFYNQDGNEVSSPQLILPVNRPVQFTVQSKDVIHDFFVPAFRMKIDAVPGIDTRLRVTPDRLGEYPVVCAELCGLGHSTMRQTAFVVSQEEFDRRLGELAQQGGGGGGGGGEEQAGSTDGRELFASAAEPAACGSCHTLADAGSTGTTGPNLDEALAGADEEFIRQSITDPGAEVTEGFSDGLMPNYGESLSEEQVDALVEYLTEVSGR
jgi:cytochrome c oxidase subunit II